MIRNFNRCSNCQCITVILLALVVGVNGATHAIVCTNCGTETQVKLEVIETIRSN